MMDKISTGYWLGPENTVGFHSYNKTARQELHTPAKGKLPKKKKTLDNNYSIKSILMSPYF